MAATPFTAPRPPCFHVVEYDYDTDTLYLWFTDGTKYIYEGFDASDADSWAANNNPPGWVYDMIYRRPNRMPQPYTQADWQPDATRLSIVDNRDP